MSYSIILGDYTPEDAFDIEVGLGINKLRVARFTLPNPKNKYSGVEETDWLQISLDGKLLFDGVVENVEDILRGGDFLGIEGVGKGTSLFNTLITKTYDNVNGRTIIKEVASLVGLDVSLVDPDNEIASSFTKEYEKVSAFDIVEEICRESAKATGEVGFYFYVNTDGTKLVVYPYDKFTSSVVAKRGVNLVSYRRKKIGRTVKNKIWVKGEASKPLPLDKDYAENLTKPNNQLNHADGVWTCAGGGATISMDTVEKIVGNYSVKTSGGSASGLIFTWNNVVNFEEFKKLYFQVQTVSACPYFHYYLEDEVGKQVQANTRSVKEGEFILEEIAVGKKLESAWNFIQSGFDWTKVKKIVIWNDIANGRDFWVDGLHLWGKRWEDFAEDAPVSPKEDFTTFTEEDPNGVWSQTSTRNTATNLRKDDDSYVFKSYGSGHFLDFEHLLDVRLTASEYKSILNLWGLTNTPESFGDLPNGSFRICFHESTEGEIRFYLAEKGGNQVPSNPVSLNTTYYLKIKRQGTTLYLYIYTDPNRTTLFQEISITCGTQAFEYLQCGFGDKSNATYGTRVASGYCENLDLQEGGTGESSQEKYGVREKIEVDDRLLNDADCLLVAKHLLSILKTSSRVIEAEISPANFDLIQGHKLRVLDESKNIDEYARILEITHRLGGEKKTTLELSKEPLDWTPLFLDSTRKLELLSKGLERKVI